MENKAVDYAEKRARAIREIKGLNQWARKCFLLGSVQKAIESEQRIMFLKDKYNL